VEQDGDDKVGRAAQQVAQRLLEGLGRLHPHLVGALFNKDVELS
jgi:hypothetical protein